MKKIYLLSLLTMLINANDSGASSSNQGEAGREMSSLEYVDAISSHARNIAAANHIDLDKLRAMYAILKQDIELHACDHCNKHNLLVLRTNSLLTFMQQEKLTQLTKPSLITVHPLKGYESIYPLKPLNNTELDIIIALNKMGKIQEIGNLFKAKENLEKFLKDDKNKDIIELLKSNTNVSDDEHNKISEGLKRIAVTLDELSTSNEFLITMSHLGKDPKEIEECADKNKFQFSINL